MKDLDFITLQDQINEYNYITTVGEYEDGYYNVNNNLEIELDSFMLTIELRARAEVVLSAYSRDYPQEADIDFETFEIGSLEIAVYDNDIEQELTSTQENWVYNTIENFISI